MIDLTVIIPVYNIIDKLLIKCLDFVVNAISNSDFSVEVIIISDGSTESNNIICRNFSSINNWMFIIQDNQGVSAARNLGIIKSHGIFLSFVDPDDFLSLDFISRMLNTMIYNKLDLIISNHFINSKKTNVSNRLYVYDKNELLISKILGNKSVSSHNISGSPWGKVYRREIIIDNNILFDIDLKRSQDILFNIQYIAFVKKWGYLDSQLYDYSLYEGSAMRKYWADALPISLLLLDKIHLFLNNSVCFDHFGYLSLSKYKDIMQNFIVNSQNKLMFSEKIAIISSLHSNNLFMYINNITGNSIFEKLVIWGYRKKWAHFTYYLFTFKKLMYNWVIRNG